MFVAVLDTSVLWPSLQRDFLLSLAIEGMYRPVWSEAILAELEYAEVLKLTKRGAPDATQRARHLIDQMRQAFDDALVDGWEPLAGTYGLPDRDDEHVVAVAVIASAGAIVTSNLRDFPQTKLPPSVEALSPADFAHNTVALSPIRAVQALEEIVARSGKHGPALTPEGVLDILAERYSMHEARDLIQPLL